MLIVDDNEDARNLYGWCMRAAGWVVGTASNGAEAVLVASVFAPDVIVMDLEMPVLGGIEAIRRLKSDEETSDVPIVALTAYADEANRTAARAAGIVEFLAKPYEPDELRALLERTVLGEH